LQTLIQAPRREPAGPSHRKRLSYPLAHGPAPMFTVLIPLYNKAAYIQRAQAQAR